MDIISCEMKGGALSRCVSGVPMGAGGSCAHTTFLAVWSRTTGTSPLGTCKNSESQASRGSGALRLGIARMAAAKSVYTVVNKLVGL